MRFLHILDKFARLFEAKGRVTRGEGSIGEKNKDLLQRCGSSSVSNGCGEVDVKDADDAESEEDSDSGGACVSVRVFVHLCVCACMCV